MRKLTVLILLNFLSLYLIGQDLEVVSAGSAEKKVNDVTVEQTVGETFVTTLEGDINVTQGFNQPVIKIIDGFKDHRFFESVALYPIPCFGELNIDVSKGAYSGKYKVTIVNINGVNVSDNLGINTKFSQATKLDLTLLAPGEYVLSIERVGSSDIKKTYKVVKINP